MAKTKIGINGFGRIGRQVLKVLIEKHKDTFDVVGINDLVPAATNAHLFKYDSNYGRFKGTVSVEDSDLVINGDKIKIFSQRDPAADSVGRRGRGHRDRVDRPVHRCRQGARAHDRAARRKSSSARRPRRKTSPS